MSHENHVPVLIHLADPDADPAASNPVAKIIEGHLLSRGRSRDPGATACDAHTFWAPEFFGLHKVRFFQDADEHLQRKILDGCARTMLNEAYFIEKSGLAYCAKMILLADSAQVEQVYGLIAADEASHLQWVRPFVAEADRGQPEGELLRFLGELIGRCDQNTLAYLVQVILEGWGLHHYKALADACQSAAPQEVFRSIQRDEAMHHHTGEVVFDPNTSRQSELIEDGLRRYTEMVRVGPQALVSVLDHELGGLNKKEKVTAFSELETEVNSAGKLRLLKSLIAGPGRERYLAKLEEKGAFTPYSPEVCASVPD